METMYVYNIPPNETVNLRQTPGGTVLVRVPFGAAVQASEHNSTWHSVDYGTYSGYMMSEFLTPTNPNGGSSGGSDWSTRWTNTPGETVNVRSGPGTNFPIITTLSHGTKVVAETPQSLWSKIKVYGPTAILGHMMTEFLTPNNPSSGGTNPSTTDLFYARVTTASGTLNMREGPGTNHSIQCSIPKDRIVLCEEITSNGWYKTKFKGNAGYLSGQYMTKLTNISVHLTYIERCKYIYTFELNNAEASYYDNASGAWCQSFVNWLLRASFMPSTRVPNTAGTGWGITFWAKNQNTNGGSFYFKSGVHKQRINNETVWGYNLNVGNTLTSNELAYTPVAGDIIYLRWDHETDPDVNVNHTGFVTKVVGTTVYTVEGNAGTPGKVRERTYPLNDAQIVGYAHPNYTM